MYRFIKEIYIKNLKILFVIFFAAKKIIYKKEIKNRIIWKLDKKSENNFSFYKFIRNGNSHEKDRLISFGQLKNGKRNWVLIVVKRTYNEKGPNTKKTKENNLEFKYFGGNDLTILILMEKVFVINKVKCLINNFFIFAKDLGDKIGFQYYYYCEQVFFEDICWVNNNDINIIMILIYPILNKLDIDISFYLSNEI